MTDPSDYARGYARDVRVDPTVNGADNVQDALAAGGGGTTLDRLSASVDGSPDISSGAVNITLVADVTVGTAISVDGVDSTKIHLVTGVYFLQAGATVGGGSAASARISLAVVSGTLSGGDGNNPLPAVRPSGVVDPLSSNLVQFLAVTAAAVVRIHATATGAGAGDTVNGGGIDIVRVGS